MYHKKVLRYARHMETLLNEKHAKELSPWQSAASLHNTHKQRNSCTHTNSQARSRFLSLSHTKQTHTHTHTNKKTRTHIHIYLLLAHIRAHTHAHTLHTKAHVNHFHACICYWSSQWEMFKHWLLPLCSSKNKYINMTLQ